MQQILIQQSDGKDVDSLPLHQNIVPSPLQEVLDSLPVDAFRAKKRLKRQRDSLLSTPPNPVTFERTWAQVFAAAGQADGIGDDGGIVAIVTPPLPLPPVSAAAPGGAAWNESE
eukprot:5660885-Amphidinium_carterae.1